MPHRIRCRIVLQHAPTNYPIAHSLSVKPYLLIAKLVEDAGGPLRAAKAMKAPGFQPTLFKIVSGQVDSPKRTSAERIAKHFGIPVDAIYDPKVAANVYRERFGLGVAVPAEAPAAPRDPVVDAIEVIALELQEVSGATRRAVGSLLGSVAEAPQDATDIGRQVRALIRAGKRRASTGT
jgi:hypothetical protein